jgi:hypothetical protein
MPPVPGPTGQKLCTASNSCIPNSACCTVMDCPDTVQVSSTTCAGGMCSVATCNAGWVDVDKNYSNGCECQDSGNPGACPNAVNVGTLPAGGNATKSGNIPTAGQENWFSVTFGNTGSTTYHPMVTLSTNPNNEFVFDIFSNCSGGTQACGTEGGTANFRTTWEVVNNNGQTNGQTWAPTPAVGSGGTIYIRVYRATGNPTCDGYVLTMTN